MSQYSVESGRFSAEKQYENLATERRVLITRKLELEQQLCQHKAKFDSPTALTDRRKIVEEINGIQKRIVKIKPAMTKLHQSLPEQYRPQAIILEEILVVLRRIEQALKGE